MIIETVFRSVSPGLPAIPGLSFDWLLSSTAMHASNGNILPVIIYGIVVAGTLGTLYVYDNFIDTDPAVIHNYNLNAPETLNGGTFTPTLYGGGTDADGSTPGALGLGTTGLIAAGAAAWFLLKN